MPKQFPDETIEQVIALYISGVPAAQIGRQFNMRADTVRSIVKRADESGTPATEAREKKKAEFAEKCWSPIIKGVDIIIEQMRIIKEHQKTILHIIEYVESVKEKDFPYKQRVKITQMLSKVSGFDLRELAQVINVLYDKQALVKGEETSNDKHTFDVNISVVDGK